MGWVQHLKTEIFALSPLVSESAWTQMHQRVALCVDELSSSPSGKTVESKAIRLNIGCAKDIRADYVNCDLRPGPGVDEVFDAQWKWPFPSNCADEVYCHHILEHLTDWPKAVLEAHRVLKVGGLFDIEVPYGGVSWHNPDCFHRSFFVPQSFDYFLQGYSQNTTLETPWEKPLFKCDSCKITRILPFRGYLAKIFGDWIGNRYTWPPIGIKMEIQLRLRKV